MSDDIKLTEADKAQIAKAIEAEEIAKIKYRREMARLNANRLSHEIGPASVVVENLTVEYMVPTSNKADWSRISLKDKVLNKVAGRKPRIPVTPIKDMSLIIHKGEQLGLIGRNGSGKSTLLRQIAGVETPKAGRIMATAQPVLLGVSAALLGNLPGVDNIRIGLLAAGLKPAEAEKLIPDVIETAQLGRSIYLPMSTYSSGMQARLRFAIATARNPEILLIDEALSTGDAAFKRSSQDRMDKLLDSAGTVVLVSHSPQEIERTCKRAIWIWEGEIIADGDAKEVGAMYRKYSSELEAGRKEAGAKMIEDYRKSYVAPKFKID